MIFVAQWPLSHVRQQFRSRGHSIRIGVVATRVTKPYQFIRFGDIRGHDWLDACMDFRF